MNSKSVYSKKQLKSDFKFHKKVSENLSRKVEEKGNNSPIKSMPLRPIKGFLNVIY